MRYITSPRLFGFTGSLSLPLQREIASSFPSTEEIPIAVLRRHCILFNSGHQSDPKRENLMATPQIPHTLIEKVESLGGYRIKTDPEHGAKGWVLSIELVAKDRPVADHTRIARVEFFFPTRELGQRCCEECAYFSTGECIALPGSMTKVEDYFRCLFCDGRRKDVGKLFRDEEATVSICEQCVQKFSAMLPGKIR